MKFRNDQHRSIFLKEAKKQILKNYNAYSVAEQAERKVQYADRAELEMEILRKFPQMDVAVKFEDSFDESMSKKCTPKTRKRPVNQKKDS